MGKPMGRSQARFGAGRPFSLPEREPPNHPAHMRPPSSAASPQPPFLRALVVLVGLASVGACASLFRSEPPPILDGTWDLLTTVQGRDYAGLLTFSPSGLVVWDGDRGERNICEALPLPSGGGYRVLCPLRMDIVPNDAGELVATVYEESRRESYDRRCLRREEQAAQMVCVEWEITPEEEVVRVPKRIVLSPKEGATVRRGGSGSVAEAR